MCKERVGVSGRQRWLGEGGGNCLKYLKNGLDGTEKRGGGTKILKRRESWVKSWVP